MLHCNRTPNCYHPAGMSHFTTHCDGNKQIHGQAYTTIQAETMHLSCATLELQTFQSSNCYWVISCLPKYTLWGDEPGIWRLVESKQQHERMCTKAPRRPHVQVCVLISRVTRPKAGLSGWQPVILLSSHKVKWHLGEGRLPTRGLTPILE